MPNYRLVEGSVQWGFHMSRAPIQVFGGAYGNGKSTGLIIKALKLAMDYPGSQGLMGRESYPSLNGTLRKDFLRWCPKKWIKRLPTKEDNSCHMTNGTVVDFRYVSQRGKTREDGSTSSNLLSATYDWAVLDQIEDPGITHKDFLDIAGRLRGQTSYRPSGDEDSSMPSSGPRFFMIGCNPAQTWFYREVIHPYIIWRDRGVRTDKLLVDEETGAPILDLFESDTYANKDNLPDGYIKTLEAMYKGQMRERFLLGKWAAFEGLVHPAFDHSSHLISREWALKHLEDCLTRHVKVRTVEAYDFGNVSPSCYILAFVDDYGRVIILDGFYQGEYNYDLHPAAIREIRRRYIGMLSIDDPILADPAIFRRSVVAKVDTGDTIAKLLSAANLWLRPAHNDIIPGIAKVNAYLADKLGVPHLVTETEPSPMLYVVDDLTWFQDEIGSYYWKKNPQGVNIDEPIDNNDHAMNTTKYLLSRLPEPSKIKLPSEKLPPKWAFWHEMDQTDYKRATRMPV